MIIRRLPKISVLTEQARFYQFSKNLLVFVPLFSSHLYHQSLLVIQFIIGFIAFCCIAAGGYILNDFIDLSSDRQHQYKRYRPLARNDLSIRAATGMLIFLISAGMLLAFLFLPLLFQIILSGYFLLVFLYSILLKKLVLFDVFTLAFFYSLRIIAGMILIPYNGFSIWLISFAFFFFLSLAYLKRYSELSIIIPAEGHSLVGRDYFINDRLQLCIFGTVSAFTSVLILMLYINLSNVVKLYHIPELLWLACPITLFWLMRIWTLVMRGLQIKDPIMFALTDKISLISFILISIIYAAAT